MEDSEQELKVLQEVIDLMEKTQKCMASCDNVSETEYKIHSLYLEELKDREIDLRLRLHGCILQEV